MQRRGRSRVPDYAAQVEAARKIYAPATNPRTGKEIYPGLEPGSEMGWGPLAGPRPLPIAVDEFKYEVFQDPNWDWRTLNFDADVARADKADNGIINATDPNLREFIARGGKLAPLSRLERHAHFSAQHRGILPERRVHVGLAGGFRASVHGTRHDALRRRRRHGRLG